MRDEIARRLVHASGTALPLLYLLDIATWYQVALLFTLGAAVALVLEAIRLYVGLEWVIYDHLTREYEQDNLAGYALYFISSAGVALAFSFESVLGVRPEIAVPAILMLTIGDPISGVLGSGELKKTKQTFVLLVMFTVCTLLAVPFVPLFAAVLGGLAATLADGVKPVVATYVIDDNLTIPPAAAVAMAVGVEVLTLL
ncbi:MAG: dolichol kinase [Haloarculaceae archaeon]